MPWELTHAISKVSEPFCLGHHHCLQKFPLNNVEFMCNRKLHVFELFLSKYAAFSLVAETVFPLNYFIFSSLYTTF